jgi:hypothetical protein
MEFFDPRSDIEKTATGCRNYSRAKWRSSDSSPHELRASSLKLRRTSRDAFLAANPTPWDDLTEGCYHGPFSDKLDEHLAAAYGSCAGFGG